jgi:hypothetical protein
MVHPRARGDLAPSTCCITSANGSSPRSRGSPRGDDPRRCRLRFIPALAGISPTPWQPSSPGPVHPRARGDLAALVPFSGATVGSSPRSRGSPPGARRGTAGTRFIPALAGISAARPPGIGQGSVHPRARGDLFCTSRSARCLIGSSPRSRGSRALQEVTEGVARFIPTLAGISTWLVLLTALLPVHPRARGDLMPMRSTMMYPRGSSPRSRGSLLEPLELRLYRRFIPALAGISPLPSSPAPDTPVHPRARGDLPNRSAYVFPMNGSSPRSRGPLERKLHLIVDGRFIPALAEISQRPAFPFRPATVHPRARGDLSSWRVLHSWMLGSPPRPRGSHGPSSQSGRSSVYPRVRGDLWLLLLPRIGSLGSSPHSWDLGRELPAYIQAHGSSPRPPGSRAVAAPLS